MSRTKRNTSHKRWYSKENKENRKAWIRKNRRRTTQEICSGETDILPRWRKTQGWMTH